jgi:hypothetical protein
MDLPQQVCPIILMPISRNVELRPYRVKQIYEGECLYNLYATAADSGLLSSKNVLEPLPTHARYPSSSMHSILGFL